MNSKTYEEYREDVRKNLMEGLKELSELIDINEIPLDYCPEKPYELLSYVEDLIEALKFEKENSK